MILSAALLAVAAIFNAVMDSVEYDTAYERSVFNQFNPKWWCKTISWKYVKFIPFTRYRPDAWHLAKSAMIIFFCLSVVFYKTQIYWLVDFVILGLVWNIVFNLFYDKIFKR